MTASDLSPVERYNRRLGLVLFFAYLMFYVGFVGVIVVDYRLMGTVVFAGLNLAIVYGMGLIVSAILLSIIFMFACRKERGDAHL
jgi:uncharacterized membrane protein (DUF485 family)